MDFKTIATSLVSILSNLSPAVSTGVAIVKEVETIYAEIKSELDETDQAAIDKGLADAQTSDATATLAADEALDPGNVKPVT